MSTISNLFIDKGSDYSIVVGLLGNNGLPIDLTDYSIRGTFKRHYESKITYELFVGVYGDDPTLGQINIIVPNELSSSLKSTRYVYQIELINKYSNEVKRVLEGIITFSP